MTRKAALVTGSSRGIGLGTAKELAKEGFALAVNAPAADDEFEAAVSQISALGVPVCAAPFDVTDVSAHGEQLERIEDELGPLTTLVNNAGVSVMQRGDLLDVTQESYDRCQDVNAKALFFLTQAFAKRLLGRDRPEELFHSIVNVTSSSANAVALSRAEYCASKAAAAMISKTFAVRLGEDNIHVYDVQPGLIATDMTASVIEDYEKRSKEGLTVLRRIGTVDDVGRIIAALATGKLPYTTGQVVAADAGLLISRY